MDFIGYLKKLDSEDWNKQVTERWTVKDVTAHMVGWERKDVEEIRRIWEKKSPPEELIAEWEMWQNKVEEEIGRIGHEKVKARPDLFGWLLQDGGEYTLNKGGNHYDHHLKQIKQVLRK